MTQKLSIKADPVRGVVDVHASVPVGVKARKESWTVFSPHFKTLGFSKISEEEALKDFDNALEAFFIIHAQDGTLDKALRDFGWRPNIVVPRAQRRKKVVPPSYTFTPPGRFDSHYNRNIQVSVA